MGIDLLNQSFEAWLNRTGNAKVCIPVGLDH